jgi:hypothetical protein
VNANENLRKYEKIEENRNHESVSIEGTHIVMIEDERYQGQH